MWHTWGIMHFIVCLSHLENFVINLSTWMMMSSMRGRTAAWGWSIHVTNWWRASGYGGLGPPGHFTCALTMANCRLPPDSPSAYSNGDTPYLQIWAMRKRNDEIRLGCINFVARFGSRMLTPPVLIFYSITHVDDLKTKGKKVRNANGFSFLPDFNY